MSDNQRLGWVDNVMSEPDQLREISNETATFAKYINGSPISSPPLSSIPEESAELTHLEASIAMPQPLIKSRTSESKEQEFSNSNQGEKQEKEESKERGEKGGAPNITFYPRMADHLLYQDSGLEELKGQQTKLKGELSGLSDMISDLISKKHSLLSDYETVLKEKRAYKKLKKSLEEEYQGYLFMLEGDYCQRLDEESQKLRQVLLSLKSQVHALNAELSRPQGPRKEDETSSDKAEQQFFELQLTVEKLHSSNQRKQERLALLLHKNAEKQAEIRQIGKKIDKCELERDLEDDPDELKRNQERYEELTKKIARLKTIKDKNQRNKEYEYSRKVKECKQKELSTAETEKKIQQTNQKLYHVLIELDNLKSSKTTTIKEEVKPALKLDPLLPRRSSTAFKEVGSRYLTGKSKLTIQPEANRALPPVPASSKSLARVRTDPAEGFDDRQELLMRKKRIYTELQRNLYFKNIENREEEKLSRIQEFGDKNKIAISSYDRFTANHSPPPRLPGIDHPPNDSIVYAFDSVPQQRKLNKKSIELHNRQVKQVRVAKPARDTNYLELCAILNRDRLLIEEDCEYDMGQLIYGST